MRNIIGVFALIAALALIGIFVSLPNADAGISNSLRSHPTSLAVMRTTPIEDTYFYLLGNEQVETVVCSTFFYHVDYTQNGNLNGAGCTITAPFQRQNGSVGNVSVNLKFSNGTALGLSGCREDSHVGLPGYYTFAIDCTSQP